MAFEALKTEISMLLARIAEKPEDRAELEFALREKLNEMRAFGMPLPEDLVALEAALDAEITAEAEEQAPGTGS